MIGLATVDDGAVVIGTHRVNHVGRGSRGVKEQLLARLLLYYDDYYSPPRSLLINNQLIYSLSLPFSIAIY